MATLRNLKMLKFIIDDRHTKAIANWTQCFPVPFLDNLVFVLALKLFEVSMPSISENHSSNLPQFTIICQGVEKMPPFTICKQLHGPLKHHELDNEVIDWSF